MGRRKTTEEFIKDAKKIHGTKYDYSKAKYNGARKKIDVICKVHGSFWQVADAHTSGSGCPKCGGTAKNTTKEFIKASQKIHGDKYNYKYVEYVNNKTKVKIICKIHGEFMQRPNEHLSACGCNKCGGRLKKTTEEFIKDAQKVHGDLYDYSKVFYESAHKKVDIICKIHGLYTQNPNNHINWQGCPKCGGRLKKTTEEFIKDAQKVHGDLYDYSSVEYVASKTKVKIICKIHGEFIQIPNDHLRGCGCQQCANTKRKPYKPSEDIKATLYCLKEIKTGFIKIGVTKNTLKQRYRKRLKEFEVIGTIKMVETDAYKVEGWLLGKYCDYKIYNESFINNGATEFLSVVPDLFKDILNKEE